MHRGFTLLETVLYSALLAILIAAASSAGFALISAAARRERENEAAADALFILDKCRYLLFDAAVLSPNTDATSSELVLNKNAFDPAENPVRLSVQNGALLVRRAQLPPEPLGAAGNAISDFELSRSGTSLSISFSINGAAYRRVIDTIFP